MRINDEKELINVYDEYGRLLYAKERKQVHMQGLRHRVVHLWFSDGECLYFQQRCADKEAFPLGFDITCAGHIDPDETALSACLRECEEELGISVAEADLQYLGTYYEEVMISCGVDRELADVYLCNQIPHLWKPNEEVVTIGKIKITEISDCLTHKKAHCTFFDLLNHQEIKLRKQQLFLHEPAYYQWLLKAISG